MKHRMGYRAGMMMAAALLLAGCSGDVRADSDAEPDSGSSIVGADELTRAVPAMVTITANGDLEFVWEGQHDLRIVTLAPPEERALHLFSVGFMDAVPLEGEVGYVRWAFDITGGYEGAGTYRIRGEDEPRENSANPAVGAIPSNVFLLHSLQAQPESVAAITEYGELIEGCTVEVSEAERTGSLSCPALGDRNGGQIRLEIAWELLEP